jgi:hypothetical protein
MPGLLWAGYELNLPLDDEGKGNKVEVGWQALQDAGLS